MAGLAPEADVVIAIDFGSAFSGFAWALKAEPKKVHKFYEWPDLTAAGGLHYCKTLTGLFYKAGGAPGSFELQEWGYSARIKYFQQLQQCSIETSSPNSGGQKKNKEMIQEQVGYLLTHFKAYLAPGKGASSLSEIQSPIPVGLTLQRMIADFLQKIGELAIRTVERKTMQAITKADVQWCMSVPGTWSESTKQQMNLCAQLAGLVKGPSCKIENCSPHELIIVLEPEAASVYCQQISPGVELKAWDLFLTVDAGGCTVDLILQQKVGGDSSSSLRVQEILPGTTGLCGGSYVDKAFLHFLNKTIEGYQKLAQRFPTSLYMLTRAWESIKYSFEGTEGSPYTLHLPARLSRAWETRERKLRGTAISGKSYDEIKLSPEDLKGMFDQAAVNQILELIEQQLVPGVDTIMLVGGFSASPYLRWRIRDKFASRVRAIVTPDEPGCAVCCGAVAWGTRREDFVKVRYSRKTYGIQISRRTRPNLGLGSSEALKDDDSYRRMFDIFMRRGDQVSNGLRITRKYIVSNEDKKRTRVKFYSTSADSDPKYVSDLGVEHEGTFIIDHPLKSALRSRSRPSFIVSTCFGGTSIEVSAEGVNFSTGEKLGSLDGTFENFEK